MLSKGSRIAMQNCNHEADTRIVVHVMHALQQGAKTIQVRTVDTDVEVIFVGTFHDLTASTVCRYLGRLWHGQELQVLLHQRHLCKHGGATITIITRVSRIIWVRYNLRLQQ